MKDFIEEILKKYYPDDYQLVFDESKLLQYLDLKTNAVNKNSKARRNLANIYSIYSLLHFYIDDCFFDKPEEYKAFGGYEYTKLLEDMRRLYGGEKIQNHALNARLNDEFNNKINDDETKGKNIVIKYQIDTNSKNNKYLMNPDYINVGDNDISKCVVEIIDKYITLLKQKDLALINELESVYESGDLKKMKEKIKSLLVEKSEARVFEIVSFAILKNYYQNKKVFIGESVDSLTQQELRLFKTGRTNANDGGIDFVMTPLGKFYQVTEVDNYDKYFLDIQKLEHFPIIFVIKTNKTKKVIEKEFDAYIKSKTSGNKAAYLLYKKSIEDILTINELTKFYKQLNEVSIKQLLIDIINCYKLEMNINS